MPSSSPGQGSLGQEKLWDDAKARHKSMALPTCQLHSGICRPSSVISLCQCRILFLWLNGLIYRLNLCSLLLTSKSFAVSNEVRLMDAMERKNVEQGRGECFVPMDKLIVSMVQPPSQDRATKAMHNRQPTLTV